MSARAPRGLSHGRVHVLILQFKLQRASLCSKHSDNMPKGKNAGSSDMQMIRTACSRKRCRCSHETCYDHSNLAAYVKSALGDTWRVILPPALGVS